MAHIEVAVLGRPQVIVDGVTAPITGRQLALAVRLAIARHVPTPSRRLLDVWPDDTGTDGALRVTLSRVRTALGPHSITRLDNGYVLSPTAHLDADRFEHLLRRARRGELEPRERISALDEAVGLWSGPAFDGLDRVPWVDFEAIRLDELRDQAVDLRFELMLADGSDSDALIADLTVACRRQPEREHRTALLAAALYRAERQSEALGVIASARRRMRDELGLDAGDELGDLEVRILRHDPSLRSEAPDNSGASEVRRRVKAATAFTRAGAYDEALRIAGDARELASANADREGQARALLALAQASTLDGSGDPAAMIDEAQTIARSLGDGALLAEAAIVRFGQGVPHDRMAALIELGEPLEMLPLTAPERIDLMCAAAVIVSFTDAGPAAERLMRTAEEVHRHVDTDRSAAIWYASRSIVGAVDGAPLHDVLDDAESSLDFARRSSDAAVMVVAIQAVLRSAYTVGDLDRVDSVLDELAEASQRALLPFGIVRAHLCRVTNALARGEIDRVPELISIAEAEGLRLRTHAAEGAVRSQRMLLALERDELGQLADVLRALVDADPGGPYLVTLALATGDDETYADLVARRERLQQNDSFPAVVALSALAAGEHRDPVLGGWCVEHLTTRGDQTITVGFGTLTLGHAPFFRGVAQLACGDVANAISSLERAVELAADVGAHLWHAHALVWLADAHEMSDDADGGARASRSRAEAEAMRVAELSPRLRRHLDGVTAPAAARPRRST